MADSSDGEAKDHPQFNNIRAENVCNKIANSYAFRKFCYNIKNGVTQENTIIELKALTNDGTFKQSLSIPKNTIIEPNIVNDILSLHFSYKTQTHEPRIRLDQKVIDDFSNAYIELHLKPTPSPPPPSQPPATEANENQKSEPNSNDIEIPEKNTETIVDKDAHARILSLESKLIHLTEQISKLLKMLTEEREKNKHLTEKLCEMEKKKEQPLKRKKASKPATVTPTGITNTQNENPLSNMSCDEYEDEAAENVNNNSINSADASNIHSVDNVNAQETVPNQQQQQHQQQQQTTTQPQKTNEDTEPKASEENSTNAATANVAKRDKNIPPIVVHDCDQKRMNERIINRNICARNEFHFTRVNISKYRIHVATLNQYDAVLALLNEFGIKYHTYTPVERKTIHVLLKHIPACYDESDVLSCLKNEHGLTPIRLTKFITKAMAEKNILSSMWHASFDPKTDKKKIFDIKQFNGQFGIVVEEMKNKSLTQCRRCWRYEHSQSNCSYDARCCNCLTSHSQGQCLLDSNESLMPSCVNCRSETHSATSKQCPVYLRILERRKSPGNSNKPKKPHLNANQKPSTFTPNVSFASAVRQNKQHQQPRMSQRNSPADPAIIDIFKQLAIQQAQMNNLLMQIAPQLVGNITQ